MAAIFPAAERGGVPPGPNAPNGLTPIHSVVGEGPLYSSSDCSTLLTVEQLNAIVSEILAVPDKLGYSFDTGKLTNMADALVARIGGAGATFLPITGGTLTGPLILAADPVNPLGAATKQYAVARTGDTMSGLLTLSGPPTNALHAATKQYVDFADNQVRTDFAAADTQVKADVALELAKKLSLTGGTMTGPLILATDPDAPLGAATKQYVDTKVATGGGGGGLPEAPADGKTYGRKNMAWADVGAGVAVTPDPTIPQNPQSANYTTVIADAGKHILHPSADTTARTITIAANATVPYPIGTPITFVNQNAAGVLTIAIASDTMRLAGAGTTGNRTLAANGIATAIKLTATEWIISGTGLT